VFYLVENGYVTVIDVDPWLRNDVVAASRWSGPSKLRHQGKGYAENAGD